MLLAETGFRGFGASHLRWMLTATALGHWSPLAWLSFALDHAVAGSTRVSTTPPTSRSTR